MSVFISSSLYPNSTIDFAISKIISNFGNNVEISAPHQFQHIDLLKNIFLKYKDQNINLILHNYFPRPKKDFVLNIATSDLNTLNQVNSLVKKSIDLSSYLDSSIYGIHAGYLADSNANEQGNFVFKNVKNSYKVALKNSVFFLDKTSKYAQKRNIKILVENLFPFNNNNNSLFCSFEQIKDFMNEAPKEIGILLDLGHLQISSKFYGLNVEEELDKILNSFSNRIYEVHLSENDSINDLHNPIKINSWQINAFKKIKNCTTEENIERVFCLEVRNETTINIKKSFDILNCL